MKSNNMLWNMYLYRLELAIKDTKLFLGTSYFNTIKKNDDFKKLVVEELKDNCSGLIAYINYLEKVDQDEINKLNFISYSNDEKLTKVKADVLESKKHILERKDDDEKVLSVIRRNIFKSYTYENNRNKQIVVSPKLVDTLIQDYDVKVFLKLLKKITEKNYESKKLLFKQYLYKIFEEESVLTKELDKEHKNIKSELTLISNEMSTNNLYSMMSDNINKDLKNLNKIAIEQIRKTVHVMPDFIEDYKLAYFMFNKMMEDIIESKREKLFLLLEISERLFRNSNNYSYVNNHGYKEYFRESMKKLLSENNDHYIREEIKAHIYSNSIEDKVKAFSLNVLLKHAGLESFDFTEYARECLERHKREGNLLSKK